MKKGDLVRYCWADFLGIDSDSWISKPQVGIVLEAPRVWVDSGAPDRNFGASVLVLWSDGQTNTYEEDELEVLNENR